MPHGAPRSMFALLERLILFFVIISTVRSTLQYLYRLWRSNGAGSTSASPPKPRHATQVTATLHQDPVCGIYVATDASLKKIFEGKVVHFCSSECRDRYIHSADT